MQVIPDNAQHIGRREEQQDAFGFSPGDQDAFMMHAGRLAVVADGMGGLEGGRAASQTALRVLIEAYQQKVQQESIAEALLRALHAANKAVYEMASAAGMESNAGTTLVAVVVHEDGLHWVSVGDSRIYLFRKGNLTQINTDHDYRRHLLAEVAQGLRSRTEAEQHPERNALTSFLGLEAIEEVDRSVKPFPLQSGDRVLLCSDGLYGVLPEHELVHLLGTQPSGKTAQTLVEATLAHRYEHQDNLTVLLFDCVAASESTATLVPPKEDAPPAPLPPQRVSRTRIASLAVIAFLLGAALVLVFGKDAMPQPVQDVIGVVTGWFIAAPDTLQQDPPTEAGEDKGTAQGDSVSQAPPSPSETPSPVFPSERMPLPRDPPARGSTASPQSGRDTTAAGERRDSTSNH